MNPYLSIIGYHGCNTLLLVILIAIYYYKNITKPLIYLSIILWQITSHIINITIKNILRLPRPDSFDKNEHDHEHDFNKIKNSVNWKNYLIVHRNFGMPSGHAQAVVSEFTFIALYFQNILLSSVAFAQVILTIYQRYAARRHTIQQLIVGSTIGIVVGVGFYKLFMMYNI